MHTTQREVIAGNMLESNSPNWRVMALAEEDEAESWWEDGTSSSEEGSSTSTQDSELGESNRLETMIFLLALTLNTVWWYVFQKLTSTQSVFDYVPSEHMRGSDPIAVFFILLIIAFWPALTVFYLARRYNIQEMLK